MRLKWNNLGRGISDIAESLGERKLSEESERLSKKMDDSTTYSAKPEGGGALAMPDRQSADNYADYNNRIAAEDEATFGSGALSSAPKTTVDKAQTYTRADYYADMGRKASGLGMVERGDRYTQRSEDMRDKEYTRKREDERFAMEKDKFGVDMEKGRIDLERTKRDDESRARLDRFYSVVSQESKDGAPVPAARVGALMKEHNLSATQMVDAYSTITGLDSSRSNQIIGSRVAMLKDAISKDGPEGAVALYNSNNPLFNDGQKVDLKTGKDGKQTITFNGKPVFSGSRSEASAFILQNAQDPLKAIEFDWKVRENMRKERESSANINQINASAANSLASAANTRQKTANEKAGGGQKPDEVRQNTNAAVKQVLLATGLAKQDPTGNLFMQALDGKPGGSSEQEIARISAQAEELVRQGVPPYKAAEQVIQGRNPAPNPAPKTPAPGKSFSHLW